MRSTGTASLAGLRRLFLVLSLCVVASLTLLYRTAPRASKWSLPRDYWLLAFQQQGSSSVQLPLTFKDERGPLCHALPGSDDVLLVMKTGATELRDRLPVHFDTTFRCLDDILIFSDVEEELHGVHILDALEFVNPEIQEYHDDFELWRRLRAYGRDSLDASELSGPENAPHGHTGKQGNPGWTLDKWKFLPMMNRTLHEYPNKQWYVFIEADTFVFWPTLLKQLRMLDPRRPLYMGSAQSLEDLLFAHGGSGYLVSRPALQAVVTEFVQRQRQWEAYTLTTWAGDAILGAAFTAAGVRLMRGNPLWQGDPVGAIDYASPEFWCFPTISYHHSAPTDIRALWEFQQEWLANASQHGLEYIRHRDVFEGYVLPRTVRPRRDWDNGSKTDHGPAASLAACHSVCAAQPECVQYGLSAEGHCYTSIRPYLGSASKGAAAGWMHERLRQGVEAQDHCQPF